MFDVTVTAFWGGALTGVVVCLFVWGCSWFICCSGWCRNYSFTNECGSVSISSQAFFSLVCSAENSVRGIKVIKTSVKSEKKQPVLKITVDFDASKAAASLADTVKLLQERVLEEIKGQFGIDGVAGVEVFVRRHRADVVLAAGNSGNAKLEDRTNF